MPDRMVWTGPDGSTVELTDWTAGNYATEGAVGFTAPEYALTTTQLAGADGVQVDAVRAAARELSVPMFMQAATKMAFRQKVRALVHAMRPKGGPGALRVSTEWGTSRTLTCYCTGGLAGDSSLKVGGGAGTWWRFVLKFYAADPWWYGDPVTVGFGLAAPSVFLSTTLPMPRALSSSSIQGQQDVDLSDVDDATPGLWVITGPGAGLVLKRELLLPDGTVDATPMSATDPRPRFTKTLTSSVTIPDGGTAIVRTRPKEQSIRRGDGSNLGGTLAAGSTFWQLADGRVNRVTVQLGNAGGASGVAMTYSPKYGGS